MDNTLFHLSTEELENRLRNNSDEISTILLSHDNYTVLSILRSTEMFVNPENYSESTHEGLWAAVEYVASIAAKKPYIHNAKQFIDPLELERIRQLSHQSVQISIILRYKRLNTNGSNSPVDSISAKMAASSIAVRAHAYPHHLQTILKELSKSTDNIVESILGFSMTDAEILDRESWVLESSRPDTRNDSMNIACEMIRDFANGKVSRDQLIEGFGFEPASLEDINKDNCEDILTRMKYAFILKCTTEECLFTEGDLSNYTGIELHRVKAFLSCFSVSFGSEDPDYFRPSATSIFLLKPFLFNGTHYCRVNCDIYSYIIPNLERRLNPNRDWGADSTPKSWNKFHEARDDYLECKTKELFSKIFRNSVAESPLFYSVDDNRKAELDCLVVHDNNFLLIESKAASISGRTREGCQLKLRTDVEKLIQHGSSQAYRVQSYIDNAVDVVTFERKNRSIFQTSVPPIRNFYRIVVTFDHADAIFINTRQLSEGGLLESQSDFWAIGIRDLFVFSELIEFPTQLLHYIERRKQSLSSHNITVSDELDLLCTYFNQNLHFDDIVNEENANIHIVSSTDPIDSYYLHQQGLRQSAAPKPQQQIHPTLKQIIDYNEQNSIPSSSEFIKIVLEMNDNSRGKFACGINDAIDRCRKHGKHRSFSISLGNNHSAVSFFVFPDEERHFAKSLVKNYMSSVTSPPGIKWAVMVSLASNPLDAIWCGFCRTTSPL